MEKKLVIEEIEKQDENITEEKDCSFVENTNVIQYKADLAFKTLIEGFDELLYVIPEYQRRYVWSKEKVENLAISFIRGLPIPPIYVYRNEKKQMDGRECLAYSYIIKENILKMTLIHK